MLLNIPVLDSVSHLFKLSWFNDDFYTLMLRLIINLFFMTILIRFLYYPIAKRKDYLFTYYLIGTFGIIRYRTTTIPIKEMTYLFLIIGISVINSLASNKISMAEMAVINVSMVGLTFVLEKLWLIKHETRKTIVYERIDLIRPDQYDDMKADLEDRTGLNINRVEVGKINFLDDTAQVRIYYYDNEQAFSDYSNL